MYNKLKVIVSLAFVALLVINFYAFSKISELEYNINNLNYRTNKSASYTNEYNILLMKIQTLSDKVDEQNKIVASQGYDVLSRESNLLKAKIKVHFTMNENNLGEKLTVTLRSAFNDISVVTTLENGVYIAEFSVNMNSNYKAILDVHDIASNVSRSISLIDKINISDN
jgi:hypothetical protein